MQLEMRCCKRRINCVFYIARYRYDKNILASNIYRYYSMVLLDPIIMQQIILSSYFT